MSSVSRFGKPARAVDARKHELLRFTGEHFLRRNTEYAQLTPRIDVIEIYLDENEEVCKLMHYNSAHGHI
jgi:Holliday junction resolvase-like predicted endonuclease